MELPQVPFPDLDTLRPPIQADGIYFRRNAQRITTGDDLGIDLYALGAAIARDRAAGFQPACLIGTAGPSTPAQSMIFMLLPISRRGKPLVPCRRLHRCADRHRAI